MFDPSKPQHWDPAARLPKLGKPTEAELREAVEKVIAYNWAEEQGDFNDEPYEGHIYHSLRVLHAWRYGQS